MGAQAQTCAFARVTLLIQHAARIHHIAICGLSTSQVPVTLVGLTLILNFLDQKKIQLSSFTKIRLVGAELLHADGQTDGLDESNNGFSQFS